MEYSLSASTAVFPLAARSLGVSLESGAGVPGNQIIVDEETFIIEEDGAIIPVPVGTIATLLPDSDEEELVEEKNSISNSQNIASPSFAAVPTFAAVSDVQLCSDGPSCTDASVATPVAADLLALPVTDSSLSDQAEVMMEISKNDESDISSLKEGNSASISDSTVTTETPSTAVESSVQQLDSSSGAGSGEIPVAAGISESDLYVQEEEEVTMDEASVDADVSSAETTATADAPAVVVSSVSKNDSNDTLSKTGKKIGSKKTSKNSHTDVNDVAENVNSKFSAKSNTKETVPSSSQNSSPEKGPEKARAASSALLAVSASGRPQRNTPRRSAIDMLKGSDIKPARRSAAEQEAEQPASKKPKLVASKKNAEPAAMPTAEEEKASVESPVSRGRGRRKASESIVASNTSVHSHQKSGSHSTQVNSLDTSDLQIEESVSNSEIMLAESVKNKEDVSDKLDEKEQKANSIKLEDPQLEGHQEVAKMNGAVQEQVVNDAYCGTKQETECSAIIGNSAVPDNSVASSSVARGRRKRDAIEGTKDRRNDHQPSVKASAKSNGDTVEQERKQRTEEQSELAKADNQVKCGTVSGDRVGVDSFNEGAVPCETDVDNSSDNVGLPGFSYDSFVTGHSSKKIAEVKSRTKNIKARNRKEKLENNLITSHDSGKDVLDARRAKLPNVESMLARIRELEAEVERLQARLREVTGESVNATGSVTQKTSSQKSQKEIDVLVDLPTDERSALDRWENKLRKLDRELEEKRTELIIKVGCITRYERQVLEKEKRLKRLEASLNLRRQQAACGNAEDASKDTTVVAVADVPLFLTGRVNLHAEEQKLELRRQELERQKNFLEDEKKKLVAKERELETREQAAVDADLFSIASVFKTNEPSASVTAAAKQSNGKIDVDFSDDDDGFGTGVQQFAFSSAGQSPLPDSLTKDDSSEEEEEIPLAEVLH